MEPQREVLAAGKYIQLVKQGKWEFATRRNTSGIVAIVALTDDRKVLLIEQFRMAVGKRVIELPAGLAGDGANNFGEDLADAARRELLEETGYEAKEMRRIGGGPPSAGMSDEIITLFLGRGLKKVRDELGDGGEEITLHEVAVDELPIWLERRRVAGNLIDLKSYLALYFAGLTYKPD